MDRGIEYDEVEDYFHARKDVQVIFMYATGKRIYSEMEIVDNTIYSILDMMTAQFELQIEKRHDMMQTVIKI